MLIDDVALACVSAGPAADIAISSATPVELFGIDLKRPVMYGAGNILKGKVWGTYTDTSGNDTITWTFKIDGSSIGTAVTAAIAAGGSTGFVIFDYEILSQAQSSQLVHWWVNIFSAAGAIVAEAHGIFATTWDSFVDHTFSLEAQVSVTTAAPTLTVKGFRSELFPLSQTCWFAQSY